MRIILLTALLIPASAFAETWIEPAPFHPKAPFVWAVTNHVPKDMNVFKTCRTNLPAEVFSNAMAIGAFKLLDIVKQSKDEIVFEKHRDKTLLRYLKIYPARGAMEYSESQMNGRDIHGVPKAESVRPLALIYLQRLGVNTSEVAAHSSGIREGTIRTFDKSGKPLLEQTVYTRGITIYRQLDGFEERGSSFTIDFGNDASVRYLNLNWQAVSPIKRIPTLSSNEIVAALKTGDGKILPDLSTGLPNYTIAKKFTIYQITPIYVSVNSNGYIYPSAEIEISADMGANNAMTFSVECPIARQDAPIGKVK